MSDTDRPVQPPAPAPGAGPRENRAPARSWFQRRGRELGEPASPPRRRSARDADRRRVVLAAAGRRRRHRRDRLPHHPAEADRHPVADRRAAGRRCSCRSRTSSMRHRWPKWLAILAVLITLRHRGRRPVLSGDLAGDPAERASCRQQSVAAFDGLQDWLTTGAARRSPRPDRQRILVDRAVDPAGRPGLPLGRAVGRLHRSGTSSPGAADPVQPPLHPHRRQGHLGAGSCGCSRGARAPPSTARARPAGSRSRNFVKVQILVAADRRASASGWAPAILGRCRSRSRSPSLVFLGSFIPVVGAVVTGALAVVRRARLQRPGRSR